MPPAPRGCRLRHPTEMSPFTEDGLEGAHMSWHETNARLADMFLVLGWNGLRRSEARAVRVEDLTRVPTPGLLIRRAAPEGVGLKSTKGRRSRRVPLADRVLPLVLGMAENKRADDLLFTTTGGGPLHRTAVLRALNWAETSVGRRIHDLRHTAACLWLARSVDPGTCRRGWVMSRSRRRTCTCISSGPALTERGWRGSMLRGRPPGGHLAPQRGVGPVRSTMSWRRLRWSDFEI